MTEETKIYFRELLESLLVNDEKVRAEQKEILHTMSQTMPDFYDRASNHTQSSIRFALTQRDSKLIEKVKITINKLNCGTFGICEECDEKINLKRLKANPTAPLCYHCQSNAELESRKELLQVY